MIWTIIGSVTLAAIACISIFVLRSCIKAVARQRERHYSYLSKVKKRTLPPDQQIEAVGEPTGRRVVAIDFETANKNPNSAIACGITVIEDFKIIDRHYWLIRPPVMTFNPEFIKLHGITKEMVQDKPTFADIWPDLLTHLKGSTLLAHYARFDKAVLTTCIKHYGLKGLGRRKWLCSLEAARAAWPKMRSHKLSVMADYLGISLHHHHAGSDADAAWQVWHTAYKRVRS